MVNVRILYTLAPQWNAKEWLESRLDLSNALGLSRKILVGKVDDDVWSELAPNLSWTHLEDGTYQVRTDAVPVKTMLDGKVIMRRRIDDTVEVSFDFHENRKTWYAQKHYTDVENLLRDLYSQTEHDLANPFTQQLLSGALSYLFTELWDSRKESSIDNAIQDFSLRLGILLEPYHSQMRQIAWTFVDTAGQESFGPPFEWTSQQPLHWEVLRCLYYIVQGYFLLEDAAYVPWTESLPVVPEYIDVSFLRTRVLSLQQKVNQEGESHAKFHPGNVEHAHEWTTSLKDFAKRKQPLLLTEHTYRLIWNTAVLIDYGQRLLIDVDSCSWSLAGVHEIIKNKQWRESLLHGFSPSHLNHNTYLDEALQFWEHGPFMAQGGGAGKAAKDALSLLKAYFTWAEAKSKGYSGVSMPVYSLPQATDIWNKVRNTELVKKFEPYYRTLGSHTPDRYFVEAPGFDKLEALNDRFPNFQSVTRTIQKHLRLIHLQEAPSLGLPAMLLVGSPGLGKTRYLYALAQILGAPMHEIAMSSMSAGFVLAGSDLTWQSAKPGKIADAFMYGLCANPLFVLDELDKVSGDTRYDPYGPLHQLLEKHTATRFMDEALQLEFNTSACSWLATANYIQNIPAPILSRFQIFTIPNLTHDQTPIVAQSIYDDLLAGNAWGVNFDPILSIQACESLYGLDARAMSFSLFDACANAAIRTELPLRLMSLDFESFQTKQSIGFLAH